jgi:iron(III) transport system substrate-binding protein
VRPAEIIVRGWIANLALPPFGNDRELLQAVEAGTCAVGVVSGLEFHQFNRPTVAAKWLQPGYIGVEAVGIGRHARSPVAARQLVEWFVDHEAQAANYAAAGLWPVNPAVRADPFDYPASKGKRNAGVAGADEVDAIRLAERAAWR